MRLSSILALVSLASLVSGRNETPRVSGPCANALTTASTFGDSSSYAGTIRNWSPAAPTDLHSDPQPWPKSELKSTATVIVRVDERGAVMRDSVWISGVKDAGLIKRLSQFVSTLPYHAAVLDGCPVSGRVIMKIPASVPKP